jgi:iron complex transport system ATP-binding protein
MSSPVLSTINLDAGYHTRTGDNVLFRNLNLALYPGELICLMGPNGSGKSTLIRTLGGLQKPLAGTIKRQSVVEQNKGNSIPYSVSVVLTDRISAANLTVGELVTFGRYPYVDWSLRMTEKDRSMVESAIRDLNLEPLRDRKVYELSDGQVQMAMIARALAQDTRLMLLDEPTAHLDLNNRVEIMAMLRKIAHQSHKAILLATHELDLALQSTDRIWLAGHNQEVIVGVPEDLVLTGAFDDIFRFKGFDLKSGKMQHKPSRKMVVAVRGEGPVYLWTRNALERNGYVVTADPADVEVVTLTDTSWKIQRGDRAHSVASIAEMLQLLQSFEEAT